MDILWKIYGKYMDKYNMEKYEKIWNIYLAKYGQYMENMWTYIYIEIPREPKKLYKNHGSTG